MPYLLMIKEQDHDGFLVDGGHEPDATTSGGIIIKSTDANASIKIFHPPPPGRTWSMRFVPGDSVTVSPVGHLLIQTDKDPSGLRCDPNEWVEGPRQYIQVPPSSSQGSGGSNW